MAAFRPTSAPITPICAGLVAEQVETIPRSGRVASEPVAAPTRSVGTLIGRRSRRGWANPPKFVGLRSNLAGPNTTWPKPPRILTPKSCTKHCASPPQGNPDGGPSSARDPQPASVWRRAANEESRPLGTLKQSGRACPECGRRHSRLGAECTPSLAEIAPMLFDTGPVRPRPEVAFTNKLYDTTGGVAARALR